MVGSGPLNSENVVGLLDELDRELHRAGGRAELYLAEGARSLLAEVGRPDRQRVTFPTAARAAHPLTDTVRQRVPPVERHDGPLCTISLETATWSVVWTSCMFRL